MGRGLLALARAELEIALGLRDAASHGDGPGDDVRLRAPAATFVTLRRGGDLRGCVGTIHPERPLADSVRANARAAAFSDPRFPPLTPAELTEVRLEVSVLSPLAPLPVEDEEALVAALAPGRDGLYLAAGERRATFLPQVWRSLPDPLAFTRKLRAKAGLAEDAWPADIRWWRFTVESWEEPELA